MYKVNSYDDDLTIAKCNYNYNDEYVCARVGTTATNNTCAASKNANYVTNTLDKVLANEINKKIDERILDSIKWPPQQNSFPDRYNILENATDEELIAEIKKRKIPVSKLLVHPVYNWKHHCLMENNLRYLI